MTSVSISASSTHADKAPAQPHDRGTGPYTGVSRPDFLVIGAMKCASSTVATYLEDHPEVDMVKGCEPRYFSDNAKYAQGPDWYQRFFDGFGGDKLVGEGSNDYAAGALFPHSAERIARDLPEAKLVFMVRHPVKRIVSAWTQYRSDSGDFVPPTLDEAITARPEYLLDQSLYWRNLQRYRAHFDDTQIFVGFMEDLSADPDAFWMRLCAFLGVPPAPVKDTIHANQTSGKRLPSATYSRLRRMALLQPVKQMMPRQAKRFLRRKVFTRPVDQALKEAEFSAEVLEELRRRLRPDTQALLAHCGRPANFWDLD